MPFFFKSGSVTANTMAIFARLALVTNCFAPFKIQAPFLRTARDFKLCASEPACGSVRQKQPIALPCAMSGR